MKKPLLSELTLREKIGQMLLGYQNDINYNREVDPMCYNRLPAEERTQILQREKFGSLWAQTGAAMRRRKIDMTVESTGRDKSAEYGELISWESDQYKIPALTALDSEPDGPGTEFPDLTVTCTPLAMGATNDEEIVYKLGAAIARELRTAGVNWRWAPVVDICSRFSCTCGMLRAFTPDDAEKQIRLALAHAKGMQSEGVAATAKHFPGNDDIEYRDSHFTEAMNSSTMEEWWAVQGKIFQGMIDGGVYSVMVGHKAFPAADDSKINGRYRPSTVSKKIITDLLKGQMGFKGVVITDGIVMNSLYSLFDTYEELIVELVNAGNDVILGVYPGAGEIIENAVADGRITEDRIDDACQRVLDMKEKLGMFEEGYRHVKYTAEEESPKTREINLEIARKAITLVRDRNNLLPIDKNKVKKVAIICSTHDDSFYDEKLQFMKAEFEARGAQVHMQRRLTSEDEIAKIAEENDLIVYAGYVSTHYPMGAAALVGDECKTFLYAFTYGNDKSIGLSMGYPYLHYDIMGGVHTFINAYSYSPDLMKAFVEGIYGEIPIVGESPVNLESATRRW